MKIQGAEAVVTVNEDVLKERERKKYRHSELDERIIRERTEKETRNTQRAVKYGVKAPEAEKIDEKTIRFDRIIGETWKEIEETSSMKDVGENVAKMHSCDLIHGDLTTSNIMINDEGETYIIDFGLSEISERVEDRAVDIHLLKQVLESSHSDKAENTWSSFLEGYQKYEKSEEVLERLEDVESRGRYK